jgi:hypothetical protein
MAFDYEELKNVAAGLLKEFGKIIEIKRTSEKRYDPTTGSNESVIDIYRGYGCTFNYSTKEIDGTRIQMGDLVILLESLNTIPLIGDVVLVNNVEMRVINVECIQPAGIAVLYKLQARQ